LLATLDVEMLCWPIIPAAAEQAPHAPWWAAEGLAERFGGYRANPRAELLGYLHDSAASVPADLLERLTQAQFEHLNAQPAPMEMHDLLCYVRLANSSGLPARLRHDLRSRLAPHIEASVALDAADWRGYGLQPLTAAPAPSSPFAAQLQAALQRNLDFVIEQQNADGSWSPNWSWGEASPAWDQAEQAWKGILTLTALLQLRAYGRLAL
jgi:hypothetical protein